MTNATPLTEDQRRLAEDYLPLARSIAKTLMRKVPKWRDEFESAACMALVDAARLFDPGHGLSFHVFARHKIKGELSNVGQNMNPKGFRRVLRDPPDMLSLVPDHENFGVVIGSNDPGEPHTLADDEDSFEHRMRFSWVVTPKSCGFTTCTERLWPRSPESSDYRNPKPHDVSGWATKS